LPLLAGALVLAAYSMAAALMPQAWRDTLRENAFDLVLALDQKLRPIPDTPIVVVDIDRASIAKLGPWPWPRPTMAKLIEAIAAARPSVIAIDILFAEPDARSPAALARQLGALVDRADVIALAENLPDGDRLLADAMRPNPVVLGFVLDPVQAGSVPGVPVLLRGPIQFTDAWNARGALGPVPALAETAAGLGALSLPGDADGVVRRVPIFISIGGELRPGLALEAVRVAHGGSAYLVQPQPNLVRTGNFQLPLPSDGLLRLLPAGPQAHAIRTLSAADVVDGKAALAPLGGAMVILGSSAPETGGLRQTATDPLTPSAQIQADAVKQMAAGRAPIAVTGGLDLGLILGLGLIALAAGLLRSPLIGLAAVIVLCALAWIGACVLAIGFDRLLDPLAPSAGGILVFGMTAVASYAVTRQREARVRRRFEQHLAPAVVRRIVEEPDLLKLAGEKRELTALFTDVEDFTAMTHRAEPTQLIAVLDAYVEGATNIVIQHGGMVDKIVGDAVHAFFNAPIDLDRHTQCAVDCAIALRDWAAAYQQSPAPAALGFGRTRIGVETGDAIVGDIGLHTKLDYTAHGDVVNAAARLEAANKELGSTICIGPVAAARLDPSTIRPLGRIALRGREEPMAVFEPWPVATPAALRERYLAAFGLIEIDSKRAAALLEELARECGTDPVPAALARRLQAFP
jgi:adenylate cyclase